MIYGPDGKELKFNKMQDKPILDREIAAVSIRDRYSTYPTSGLTPGKLARIFKEADYGDISRQSELFEEMEEKDPHLFSVLQTRKNSVLGLDWEIIPFSDDREDIRIVDFIRKALEFEGLEENILDLLDAISKGFAVNEIMWEIKNNQVWIKELKWRHQKKFSYDEQNNLKVHTEENPGLGEELLPNKFVVHKYKARSGHPSRAGILRVVAWMYLFKNYSIKDWVSFAEIYGMPLRLGKYDKGATPEDKASLIDAISSLGSDAGGIISKNMEIEFISAIRGSSDVYKTLVNFCNAEMSKAVLGQTLTTEVGDKGSYAASKTHNEVRQDLKEADCKALAETIRKDIIRPLVLFNFGPSAEERLPWIKYHFEESEDLKAAAETYSVLIGDIGLPVAEEHLYEKFGVPKPKQKERLVIPPTRQVALKNTPIPLSNNQSGIILPENIPARTQPPVDDLADRCLDQSGKPLEKMLEPLIKAIQEAQSLEELRDRLPEVYREMDSSEFEDLLGRAIFIADLYGRWTTNE